MNIYKLSVLLCTLLLGAPTASVGAKGTPKVFLADCQIPEPILSQIGRGVQYALDNQAAFIIDDKDLFHVHLLVSKETLKLISGKNEMSALELMGLTDALLFHSQEEKSVRDFFPVNIRKRRNIFYNRKTNELKILNTDNYPVDKEFFTIWQEEDLGFEETFQVSFARLPHFVDQECKLSAFDIHDSESSEKVVITNILMLDLWKPNTIDGKSCSCSGAIWE